VPIQPVFGRYDVYLLAGTYDKGLLRRSTLLTDEPILKNFQKESLFFSLCGQGFSLYMEFVKTGYLNGFLVGRAAATNKYCCDLGFRLFVILRW